MVCSDNFMITLDWKHYIYTGLYRHTYNMYIALEDDLQVII